MRLSEDMRATKGTDLDVCERGLHLRPQSIGAVALGLVCGGSSGPGADEGGFGVETTSGATGAEEKRVTGLGGYGDGGLILALGLVSWAGEGDGGGVAGGGAEEEGRGRGAVGVAGAGGWGEGRHCGMFEVEDSVVVHRSIMISRGSAAKWKSLSLSLSLSL